MKTYWVSRGTDQCIRKLGIRLRWVVRFTDMKQNLVYTLNSKYHFNPLNSWGEETYGWGIRPPTMRYFYTHFAINAQISHRSYEWYNNTAFRIMLLCCYVTISQSNCRFSETSWKFAERMGEYTWLISVTAAHGASVNWNDTRTCNYMRMFRIVRRTLGTILANRNEVMKVGWEHILEVSVSIQLENLTSHLLSKVPRSVYTKQFCLLAWRVFVFFFFLLWRKNINCKFLGTRLRLGLWGME